MATTTKRTGKKPAPPAWPVKGSKAGFDLFDSSTLETMLIRAWQDRLAEQRARDVAQLRVRPADGEDGDAG